MVPRPFVISGPTNPVHTSGADIEGGPSAMDYLDAEKFQPPVTPAGVLHPPTERKDRTLIAPLTIPGPHDNGAVSSTSELFAHDDHSETRGPVRTASQLSHRKPAPPEVPADVDPTSGSPMPQVYSDTESPLEPPLALRPRNG